MKNTLTMKNTLKSVLRPLTAAKLLIAGIVATGGVMSVSAVSADNRAAGGFLYSEYLSGALATDAEGISGSFVVETSRPFERLQNKTRSVLAREAGGLSARDLLDKVIHDVDVAARWRERLEDSGWELANFAVQDAFLSATEGAKQSGFLRTAELDVKSSLGNRVGSFGINFLGALRESSEDAVAWQFRAQKGLGSDSRAGGSAGLIYRRVEQEVLLGANVFTDYETHELGNFWRWSFGAEARSQWIDLFANYYDGITDDEIGTDESGAFTAYSADGYDVQVNVHSPTIKWFTAVATYYNFDDGEDSGLRYGAKLRPPQANLEFEIYRDTADEGNNFGGIISWNHRFGKSHTARRGSDGFDPHDYFFEPVQREYTQRIRKEYTADGSSRGVTQLQVVEFSGAGEVEINGEIYDANDTPINLNVNNDSPLEMITRLVDGDDKVTLTYTTADGNGVAVIGSSVSFDGVTMSLGYGNVSVDVESGDLMLGAPGAATISMATGTEVSIGYGSVDAQPSESAKQPLTLSLNAGMTDLMLEDGNGVRVSTNGTELELGETGGTVTMAVKSGKAAVVAGDEEILEVAASVNAEGEFEAGVVEFPAAGGTRPEGTFVWQLNFGGGVDFSRNPPADGVDYNIEYDSGVIHITYQSTVTRAFENATPGNPMHIGTLENFTDVSVNVSLYTTGYSRTEVHEGLFHGHDGDVSDNNSPMTVSVNTDTGNMYLTAEPVADTDGNPLVVNVVYRRPDNGTWTYHIYHIFYSHINDSSCLDSYVAASGSHDGHDLSRDMESLFEGMFDARRPSSTNPFNDIYLWINDEWVPATFPFPSGGFDPENDDPGINAVARAPLGPNQPVWPEIIASDSGFTEADITRRIRLSGVGLLQGDGSDISPGDVIAFGVDGNPPAENAQEYVVYADHGVDHPSNRPNASFLNNFRLARSLGAYCSLREFGTGNEVFQIDSGFRTGSTAVNALSHQLFGQVFRSLYLFPRIRAASHDGNGWAYGNSRGRESGVVTRSDFGQLPPDYFALISVVNWQDTDVTLSLAQGSTVYADLQVSQLDKDDDTIVYGVHFPADSTVRYNDLQRQLGAVSLVLSDTGVFSHQTRDHTLNVEMVVDHPGLLPDDEGVLFAPFGHNGTVVQTVEVQYARPSRPVSLSIVESSHEDIAISYFRSESNLHISVYFEGREFPASGRHTLDILISDDVDGQPSNFSLDTVVSLILEVPTQGIENNNLEVHPQWTDVFAGSVNDGTNLHYEEVDNSGEYLDVDAAGNVYLVHSDSGDLQPNTEYMINIRVKANRNADDSTGKVIGYSVTTGNEAGSQTCPVVYTPATTYSDDEVFDIDLSRELPEVVHALRHVEGDSVDAARLRRFQLYFPRVNPAYANFQAAALHHFQPGGFYQHFEDDESEVFITPITQSEGIPRAARGRPGFGLFSFPRVPGSVRYIGANEVISISDPDVFTSWADGDLHHDNHAHIYRVYTDPARENKEFLAAGESDFDGTRRDSRTHSCTLTGSEFYITDEGVRTTDINQAGHFTPNPGSPIR